DLPLRLRARRPGRRRGRARAGDRPLLAGNLPVPARGMSAPRRTEGTAAEGDPALLEALSDAVESGAGLPAVARAAARVLDASLALIDRSGAVRAVAGASPDQERKLLAGGPGVTAVELRVAGGPVGELRYRARAEPDPVLARMVATLLALEM